MFNGQINTITDNTLLKSFVNKFTSDEFFIDFVKLTLYPADFGSIQSNKTIDYIKSFLKDIEKIIRVNRYSTPNTINNIQMVTSLLHIRESRSNILNENNIFQHLNNADLAVTKLIQNAIENKIEASNEFRHLKDGLLNQIQAYYEIQSVSGNISLLDNLTNSISNNKVPVFEALTNYKNVVINAYNDLSKIQTLNKEETNQDYFVLTDKKSVDSLSENLYKYVSAGYSFYKTGYKIFDGGDSDEGFESSSVHIISAPSNHGKSLFLANLTRSIIEHNIDEFKENEVVLFLTLEDDIHKLFRRFAAIFGNYQYASLKRLFKKCYEVSKMTQDSAASHTMADKIKGMFNNVVHTSIIKTTGEKVGLVLKHCNENTFSPGDLGRFIDQLKVEGYKVKVVFSD